MPTYRIKDPSGREFDVTAPEGATEQEVMAYAQRNFKMAAAPEKPKASKPFGQQLNETIADVPRQLGLTARYGLEGVGDVLDFVASPIRAGMNVLGADIKGRSGETLANMVGLPQPQSSQERVVGDAARLVAGAALPIAGGARLAQAPLSSVAARNIGGMLSSNPAQQLASAAAAGGAGGYTRETGGNAGSQVAASLAAGVAAPFAMSGAQRAATSLRQAVTPRALSPQQIDITINNSLRESGLKLDDLPADVARTIRADVHQAMQTKDNLSQEAVRRLADYRLTGLTPTRASLTLNPGDVTRQKNLAKLGANSSDPAAQQLAEVQNVNNKTLTQGLNSLGATNAGDPISGAQRIMGALSARNDRAKQIIGTAYQSARDTQGRAAMLDPATFTRKADDMLQEQLLQGKLPSDVRNLLNRTATGEMPLTVDVAEQLKTRIGELQRSTIDMAERKALGIVRSALDDTPLQPGQQIGKESIDAFNKARALNRSWMNIVDRTPALQAVRDGIEPDKFVQKFIVGTGDGASVMSVAQLKNSIKGNSDAMQAVKEQITAFLKNKALGGAADEVGAFSQSAYNKALNAVGDRKLNLFFSPDEVNQLKAIGRVASYEQVQPVGSAINNSNTASAMGGLLERLAGSPLLGKVPLGRAAIGDPLQNVVVSQQAARTLNAPDALGGVPILPAPRQPIGMSPAALLFGPQSEEERKRRERSGLLTP